MASLAWGLKQLVQNDVGDGRDDDAGDADDDSALVVILMVLRFEIHMCMCVCVCVCEWGRRTLFGLILWLAGGWLGKLGGWAAEKDGLAMLTLIIYQSDFLSQKWTWLDKIFSPKGRSINWKSFKDRCDCPAKIWVNKFGLS